MKLKTRLAILLVIGVALIYTACKKSSNPQTLSTKTVSSQVALNLAQTLYGGFGTFSISNGLNAPSTVGVNRQKIRLNMTKGRLGVNDLGSDITCGLSVDTTLNFSTTLDDNSSASVAGSIKFTFLCTNGTPSGFTMLNDLTVTESTAELSGTYKLNENLTLQSLNPLDDYSNITMNGTLGMSDNLKYKTGSKQTTTESYNYTFSSILINSNGDILSGSATFNTKGTNTSGTWSYSGTAVFLGNGMVKITIDGTVYTVNLQTGQVS